MDSVYRIGLDIGSTTIKTVVVAPDGNSVFSAYRRHHAKIKENLSGLLQEIHAQVGDALVSIRLTGSVGMGIAEKYGLPFVQEVVAATHYVKHHSCQCSAMIDIGGEDAKVVFFKDGNATDLRMNGNCAGGTGAFMDQMALLLGGTVEQMNELALRSERIYPIASRCGVFSKTDVQNLIAKNTNQADIAASIFHAVAVQVVVTLAHGHEVRPPVLFCGGPLTFLPALRKAFKDYLHLAEEDILLPENSHLIPAWGTALTIGDDECGAKLSGLMRAVSLTPVSDTEFTHRLEPVFAGHNDYEQWKNRITRYDFRRKTLAGGIEKITLGIDSGSTTTKIVAMNQQNELLYTYYANNNGNPIATVEKGLEALEAACRKSGTEMRITGSCATGYGEDLIKAAFHLDDGIVETIAHYEAARHLKKDVSFILDIGGQDMKAMFVSGGVINRIEINEACSSGCGSFLETFARSLGYSVQEFGMEACQATHPYDLGTRCTVFMNSKVKQAMREGAAVADIAAGLSYSVVKNCLYKVLRLKDTNELGRGIVVQGGTMRNDSVVHAFEKLTGKEVARSSCPELMGAIGCALHARKFEQNEITLNDLSGRASYTARQRPCHGCENNCYITTYTFSNGNRYYSGNRCEKVFTNRGNMQQGMNAYTYPKIRNYHPIHD